MFFGFKGDGNRSGEQGIGSRKLRCGRPAGVCLTWSMVASFLPPQTPLGISVEGSRSVHRVETLGLGQALAFPCLSFWLLDEEKSPGGRSTLGTPLATVHPENLTKACEHCA